jgi:succinate-semialdehyde dehydrogenase/glutarate-semialdehyde dehydrogenase
MSQTIESINPTTGEVIKQFNLMTNEEIENKIQRAVTAAEKLAKTPIAQRCQWMRKLGDVLDNNAEKYGRTVTTEMGKTLDQAIYEAKVCAKFAWWYADNAPKILADKPVDSTDLGKKAMKIYQPVGVLFQIAPFNYPLWQCFRFLTAAVTAGNVALIRPSHATTMSGYHVEEAFKEAGFPDGTVQVVLVSKDQASKLIADPRIMGVTITGSTNAGKAIAKQAAENLKRHVMELGGSDPYIIREDVDIDQIMAECIRGRTSNCGQCCVSAKRFIVNEKIYNSFVNKYVEHMNKLKVGNPMDKDINLGPLARFDLRDTVHDQVQRAKKDGARVLCGGEIPKDQKGAFYPPTVLVDVDTNNTAWKEEIFGPVAVIVKAKDDKEAVALANDTIYGLGGGVFTKDLNKADEIARQLHSGMAFINRCAIFGPQIPFGGVKAAGYGKECGEEGLLEWVTIKSVVVA